MPPKVIHSIKSPSFTEFAAVYKYVQPQSQSQSAAAAARIQSLRFAFKPNEPYKQRNDMAGIYLSD